jgi:hypothetical protein
VGPVQGERRCAAAVVDVFFKVGEWWVVQCDWTICVGVDDDDGEVGWVGIGVNEYKPSSDKSIGEWEREAQRTGGQRCGKVQAR